MDRKENCQSWKCKRIPNNLLFWNWTVISNSNRFTIKQVFSDSVIIYCRKNSSTKVTPLAGIFRMAKRPWCCSLEIWCPPPTTLQKIPMIPHPFDSKLDPPEAFGFNPGPPNSTRVLAGSVSITVSQIGTGRAERLRCWDHWMLPCVTATVSTPPAQKKADPQ